MAQKEKMSAMKYHLLKKVCSIEELRQTVRKKFREQLQENRDKHLWERRVLRDKIVSDVNKSDRQSAQSEVFDTDEMMKLLNEIQQEMHQKLSQDQAEQYLNDLENETDALRESNGWACSICDNIIDNANGSSNLICTECVKLHFSEKF